MRTPEEMLTLILNVAKEDERIRAVSMGGSRANKDCPVDVYFNGGGLMAGSGSEPRYAGMSMARKGVIGITANYREGIFGFF